VRRGAAPKGRAAPLRRRCSNPGQLCISKIVLVLAILDDARLEKPKAAPLNLLEPVDARNASELLDRIREDEEHDDDWDSQAYTLRKSSRAVVAA
jgi:hypothetical protein